MGGRQGREEAGSIGGMRLVGWGGGRARLVPFRSRSEVWLGGTACGLVRRTVPPCCAVPCRVAVCVVVLVLFAVSRASLRLLWWCRSDPPLTE